MAVQIALLRAINLGSHNKVPMAGLRAMFTDLGFEKVQTLLLSGNVVFSGGPSGGTLEQLLEAEARKRLKLNTDFIVRTSKQWDAIVAANPLKKEARSDPAHLLLMACKEAVGSSPKVTGARGEIVKPKGKEIYIYYPEGVGRSRLKIHTVGTARNWNTVMKLAALAKSS